VTKFLAIVPTAIKTNKTPRQFHKPSSEPLKSNKEAAQPLWEDPLVFYQVLPSVPGKSDDKQERPHCVAVGGARPIQEAARKSGVTPYAGLVDGPTIVRQRTNTTHTEKTVDQTILIPVCRLNKFDRVRRGGARQTGGASRRPWGFGARAGLSLNLKLELFRSEKASGWISRPNSVAFFSGSVDPVGR